ncbi:chemotaxis response regulator protein-glutamate methylesterase [Malikia sp.]|uniref:protein-glutamate methylesterase/protein-glutamine glutaminase n=1 Tax=Malikia sp. TaxID=2070706 RepID=UPI002611B38B|nr:chemotaxis response regulator protein-glutamate methylesterase [Malikia sp.]MDD2728714.1 chemotaxis response regulator protein-glutamate methylesterase [Malikia sp.]
MARIIKVLVVDDSAMVRQALTAVLESDPEIRVIATAPDPYVAAQKIAQQLPDVITLDVEMPRMDGITFLRKLMSQHPVPVVICSSLAQFGSDTVMRALESGAVDIIAKPALGVRDFLMEERLRIIDVVKGAAVARLKRLQVAARAQLRQSQEHLAEPRRGSSLVHGVPPKLNADVVLPPPPIGKAMVRTTERVVVVGASTGGTEALRSFLEVLPADSPGIVVVQHMPENFTASFAKRLDSLCRMDVKEAVSGDSVLRGRVLIAPGNRHTLLKRSGARYLVEVVHGELVSRHRPSVDVLFRSAATYAGSNAIGVIMTGMGDDGAHGMREMHVAGAFTLAQDEASCVVFGMPAEAIKLGGVDKVSPLDQLAHWVTKLDQTEDWMHVGKKR